MRWWILIALAGCGRSDAPPAGAPAPPPPREPIPVDAPPAGRELPGDPTMGAMLAKPADDKTVADFAFQHQNDTHVATACAAALASSDRVVRLRAATCLEHLTALADTSVLGGALDAIDAETDPEVRERVAWGIKGAEAVTAGLDDRVIAMVSKYPDDTGAHLFDTLFPQYLASHGPTPPAKAQALALAAIGQDGTPLQLRALDAIRLLDDKPAVCRALHAALRPDAKRWTDVVEAISAVGEPCRAEVPAIVDALVASKKPQARAVTLIDHGFALDAATRGKLLAAVRAWITTAEPYEQGVLSAAQEQLTKPRKERKK